MANLPVGHNYTKYGTPMHVTQLVLVLLKATFAEIGGDSYAYRFTQDFNTTGVVIDIALNKASGIYGVKPQLVVARGSVGSQQVALGDTGVQDVKTMNARRTSLIQSSVTVTAVSKLSAEADLLGNEVFNFLVMCRSQFPSLLGLHQAAAPTLSEVATMEQDDTMYYTVASMPYTMQYKYRDIVPQNLLAGINFYANQEPSFQLDW